MIYTLKTEERNIYSCMQLHHTTMEISDSSLYGESHQTGFNGTYEPTDSIIVRTMEILRPLEVGCKGESHDETNDYSWSTNSDYRLNENYIYTEHLSEQKDTPAKDGEMDELTTAAGKYHQDDLSDIQSDSELFDVNTGVARESSARYSPSTPSSTVQTDVVDTERESGRLVVEQNIFTMEETSTLKKSSSLLSDGNSVLDCEYNVQTETSSTAKDSESSPGIDTGLFKSKRNVINSSFIYRNETGEPSLISPCTAALTEHQDLDPTRYGPNGNLDNRCEICGKTFSQPYLLKVHFRIHSGFKPYICELCNKGFAQSSGLRSHKLTHTGEKPYKCDVCDKTFTASGSLNMHYRTHNGERPFSCEVCGRTFRYRSAMNKHMMIHTGDRPYTCDDCGKDFSRKGNLETHRRIHSNSMPYQCDICEKKFNQMSNLRTHKVTHSLVKPYRCDLCGSEFFTKFNMQRHIVIQHIKKENII